MTDTLRPLTLLLGVVSFWAVSVLLLALTGMGGRIATAPAEAGKVAPLTALSLTRSNSRLGPITDYLEVGARPLFTGDRRPAPVVKTDGEQAAAVLDAILTSVLITPTLKLAILTDNKNGTSRRVRVGEMVEGSGGWKLLQLEPRRAVLEGPNGQQVLDLRVFDGKGAAAPTAVVPAPASASPVAAVPVAGAPASAPGQPKNEDDEEEPQGAPKLEPIRESAPVQDKQIEAIRARIEARRAKLRADARDAANKR